MELIGIRQCSKHAGTQQQKNISQPLRKVIMTAVQSTRK